MNNVTIHRASLHKHITVANLIGSPASDVTLYLPQKGLLLTVIPSTNLILVAIADCNDSVSPVSQTQHPIAIRGTIQQWADFVNSVPYKHIYLSYDDASGRVLNGNRLIPLVATRYDIPLNVLMAGQAVCQDRYVLSNTILHQLCDPTNRETTLFFSGDWIYHNAFGLRFATDSGSTTHYGTMPLSVLRYMTTGLRLSKVTFEFDRAPNGMQFCSTIIGPNVLYAQCPDEAPVVSTNYPLTASFTRYRLHDAVTSLAQYPSTEVCLRIAGNTLYLGTPNGSQEAAVPFAVFRCDTRVFTTCNITYRYPRSMLDCIRWLVDNNDEILMEFLMASDGRVMFSANDCNAFFFAAI